MISVTLMNLLILVLIFCAGILAGKVSDKIMSLYKPNLRIWISSSPTIVGVIIRKLSSLILDMIILLLVIGVMIIIAGFVLEIIL